MPYNFFKSLFSSGKRPPQAAATAAPSSDRAGFVAFIADVDEPCFLSPDEKLDSDQASMRLRVGLPARELARRIPVCLVPLAYIDEDPALTGLGEVRAIVVGKVPVGFFIQQPERAARLLEWIEAMARQHRVVADFSDDLAAAAAMYSQPALIEIQKRLLRACPATVPSNALRERLAADSCHDITVIEDPYESADASAPRFAPGPILHLAWFGVFGPPLRAFLEAQFAGIAGALKGRPAELAFVTYASQAALVEEMAASLRAVHPDFSVRPVAWSLDATAQALAQSDLVVLPQDAASDWGRVKSHNRLVETIRAGRFAIVSPVPAYLELDKYAWVGTDLAEGIEWALSHPDEVQQRLVAGQAYVGARFAPARIAAQWAQVLGISDIPAVLAAR